MLMAVVLDAQDRFEQAERYHRLATKTVPDAPQVWNNFGNHWWKRKRLDEARRAFERAITLDPAHPNANLQLARIAVEEGRAAAALPFLDRLRAADSGDPGLLVLYGRALADRRDFTGAEKAFAAALERAPADFDIRLNLGLAALNAGNYARALEVFEGARRQQPRNADVLYGLARTYVEAGQLEPALSSVAEAIRVAPQREDVIALVARTASLAGSMATPHKSGRSTWP